MREGRVVKGVRFVDIRDTGDPVELAGRYYEDGADEVAFLDITASHEKRAIMIDVVRRVAAAIFIPFTVGGGLRSVEDMRQLLLAGADKVSINTAAVENPQLIRDGSRRFGAQCIVVAVDAKRAGDSWEVYTHGGRKAAGIDALSWMKEAQDMGAGEILLTSMDADGTQAGYDLPLTRAISEATSVPLIASGGAGNAEHMYDAIVEGKADAVLAAGIFHFGTHRIREIKEYLAARDIPVRL